MTLAVRQPQRSHSALATAQLLRVIAGGLFQNVFVARNPSASVAVNWGLAAAVYLLAGWSIAALIDRSASSRLGPVRGGSV